MNQGGLAQVRLVFTKALDSGISGRTAKPDHQGREYAIRKCVVSCELGAILVKERGDDFRLAQVDQGHCPCTPCYRITPPQFMRDAHGRFKALPGITPIGQGISRRKVGAASHSMPEISLHLVICLREMMIERRNQVWIEIANDQSQRFKRSLPVFLPGIVTAELHKVIGKGFAVVSTGQQYLSKSEPHSSVKRDQTLLRQMPCMTGEKCLGHRVTGCE